MDEKKIVFPDYDLPQIRHALKSRLLEIKKNINNNELILSRIERREPKNTQLQNRIKADLEMERYQRGEIERICNMFKGIHGLTAYKTLTGIDYLDIDS